MKMRCNRNYFGATLALFAVLGIASLSVLRVNAQAKPGTQTNNNGLIAIDVLLEPNQAMLDKANASNALLRGNYAAGYALDATHAPHVTMLQRYVRVKDLDAVKAALTKLFATERPTELKLKSTGYQYTVWQGVAVTILVVERTPELMALQQKVASVMAPFPASGGTAAAFIDTPSKAEIVGYVEQFVPKSSGEHYFPHVTVGVANEDFVKKLKAAPFEPFTFAPRGVGIYQLGNFGTASKKLWEYQPAP